MASQAQTASAQTIAFLAEQLRGIQSRVVAATKRAQDAIAERDAALAERTDLAAKIDAELIRLKALP